MGVYFIGECILCTLPSLTSPEVFRSPLFEQSSFLWSGPVDARRRRAKALRRRAP